MTSNISKPSVSPPRGQFFRIEKYAVQAPRAKTGGNNLIKVASEAARIDGFCSHVEHAQPPKLVWGVNPLEAATLAKDWSRRKTAMVFHKPSQTTLTRKYRDDKPSALVGVISVPPEWNADARWDRFVKRSVDWLVQTHGADRLKSVVEHHDEQSLHLHFWVVARDNETFSDIHPGEKAIDTVGRKSPRMLRDMAYKQAMSNLLDEFHCSVASGFGLERETVSGKRLTREEWLRKKYLNQQHEVEIQRRISEAVTAALCNQQRKPSAVASELASQTACSPLTSMQAPVAVALVSSIRNTEVQWVRPRHS